MTFGGEAVRNPFELIEERLASLFTGGRRDFLTPWFRDNKYFCCAGEEDAAAKEASLFKFQYVRRRDGSKFSTHEVDSFDVDRKKHKELNRRRRRNH